MQVSQHYCKFQKSTSNRQFAINVKNYRYIQGNLLFEIKNNNLIYYIISTNLLFLFEE